MPSVTIIYGSSGGNTEMVCEKVQEVLEMNKIPTKLLRVERSTMDDLKNAEICILAAPTYEHGVIQHHFFPFLKELKHLDLQQKRMSVIGLGDTKYDDHYHIESANILEKAIKDSNGNMLIRPLRVNGLTITKLDGIVKSWSENLIKTLLRKS
ncbi:MAG: flavodoxin family protein [Candidatus Altimarinota bacterium]